LITKNKVGAAVRQEILTPLSWYLTQLEYCSDGNEDGLGSLIGYSILNSLLNFCMSTRSSAEYSYREQKCIYKGLEESVEACKKGDLTDRLHVLKQTVEPKLAEYLQQDLTDSALGPLTVKLIDYLKTQPYNHEDSLRRFGISLKLNTPNSDIREYKSNKRKTLYDHNQIENVLK
jgi:hypothetical protein